jgi:hypothetical protein
MVTYLTAHIFEIRDSYIRISHRAVHLLKCLACEVSSDTLVHDIVEEVLDQVHFWEVPGVLLVFLT